MSRSEMMKMVKALRKQGFTVERTGSGHWMVTSPEGTTATIGFSPSHSGLREARKRLVKMGYQP